MNLSQSLCSVALVTVTAIATLALPSSSNASPRHGDRDPIEGAFNATVTIKSCEYPYAVIGSTQALLLFHRGGSVTIDNTQARLQRGLILGTWDRERGRRYTSEVSHFNYFEDGTLSGSNKVTRTIVLGDDGDSFIAQLRVRVLGVDGTLLREVCPTETGARVTF
jgi:hypothetical protein